MRSPRNCSRNFSDRTGVLLGERLAGVSNDSGDRSGGVNFRLEKMQLSRSVAGIRKGMTAHFGTKVIEKGLMQQWSRQVCVRIASTALIFSALQPVRPLLHVPQTKQQVGLGRIVRGNHSSLLLRQCAARDVSHGAGAGTVLLETRECADGSIMYRFGTLEQKDGASLVGSERGEGQCPARPSTEEQEVLSEDGDSVEVPGKPNSEPVVVVNGLQHTRSPGLQSTPVADEQDPESISDITRKLTDLDLRDPSREPASTNGLAPAEQATAEDMTVSGGKELDSGESKDRSIQEEKRAFFNSGAAMIPHPEKAARGGEDAFFIEGDRWIGVADGVGGWANSGINAGLYARELMMNCAELARDTEKESDPKTVLVKGFSRTKALGSTTAVVASVSNQTLNVVNMGDSGFVVIRDGKLIERSTPMQRGFNFPYQIGSEGDDPLIAEVYRVAVETGDVIVLASDGLFDNLFQNEIVNIVRHSLQTGCGPQGVADNLAYEAHKVGASNDGLTPFAKEAQRVGYSYTGGKMDDITAVVAFVS